MTQDLHGGGSIGGYTSTMQFANDSAMAAPLIHGGDTNATVPNFTDCVYGQSSTMSAPFMQGGYTDLLHGVHQDAAMSLSARKLNFDEKM